MPSQKYIETILSLRTDEDKDQCLRFLTIANNHTELYHSLYSDTHINAIIESSDYILYVKKREDTTAIIAFALIKLMSKKKGKILNILLVCAIPNKKRFGQLISHSVYNFGIQLECKFLYTSPRTPDLRRTFIQHGFEPIYGIEGVDEVLEKEIEYPILSMRSRGKTHNVR